jgi:cAMP-dependent protein kinase regulator
MIIPIGEFHVYVNRNKVAVRARGTLFGELALLYQSPRAATVTAVTDSVVWKVDRFTFRYTHTHTLMAQISLTYARYP